MDRGEARLASGGERRCDDEVWNVGVADLATATAAVIRSFENLEILEDLEVAVERAARAMDGGVPEIGGAIGRS